MESRKLSKDHPGPGARRRHAWGFALGSAALGLGLTALAWYDARVETRRTRQAYFEYRVRDAAARIRQRLTVYDQLLKDTRGLFQVRPPTRREFRTFIQAMGLTENYPGIQGIGFARIIPKADLGRHVAQVRREGFPGYAVHPLGDRDPYTSIVFIEPFEGRNLRAFGFDMHSEPIRRAAMDQASDLDDAVMTDKLRLVQEMDEDVQSGFILYLPLYGAGPTAPAQRRAHLRGWVYAPFRMDDFMAGVLGERGSDLEIQVFDDGGEGAAAEMYHSRAGPAAAAPLEAFTAHRTLDLRHHRWNLEVKALPAFLLNFGPGREGTVLVAGLLGTTLLSTLAAALVGGWARAERLALASDTRYRAIMRQAGDAVLLVSLEGRIREANDEAGTHFGYPPQELVRMNIRELYPPGNLGWVEEKLALLRTVREAKFDASHLRKDGTHVESEVRARVVDIGGEPLAVAVIRDVTERRRAEAELAQRHAELEELNRSLESRVKEAVADLRQRDQMLTQQSRQAAMGEMIGNIAHQWRQPLSSLSMLLAGIRDAWRFKDRTEEELQALFLKGETLIQNMSQTITDFRNFFQPGKERVAFPLAEQARSAADLVDASYRAANIELTLEGGEDVVAYGFPSEFSQALLNVLVNARQVFQERGREAGRVEVAVSKLGAWGQVLVRDNAGGIPPEVIDRVFDPFFTTRRTGSGIGLHMTRQIIVGSMGGQIFARNTADGAEFTLLVPLAKAP